MESEKKYFYILNHPWCPMPYTHRFFVEKFAKGFEYHGYTVKFVEKASDIVGPGMMIMCDIRFHFYWNNGIRNWRRDFFIIIEQAFNKLHLKWFDDFCWYLKKRAVKQIAPMLKKYNIVTLAWFWHEHKDFLDAVGIPVIYTAEYFWYEPQNEVRKTWWKFFNAHAGENVLPIHFAAAFDPSKVGVGPERERDIFVSFIGERRYKKDWQELFAGRPDCRIIPTPPYIPEAERVDIYERTLISLGLEGTHLLVDGIVTERIYEALAYGAVCLTNHPQASIATDGAAQYIESIEELGDRIEALRNHPDEVKRLREKGYAFIREKGTYAHEAEKFIKLAEKFYGAK